MSISQVSLCYTSGIMKDQIYDDLAIEEIAKKQFGIALDVGTVIVRQVPVSHTAVSTVFLTAKKQLYAYIVAQSPQTLADVKKVLSRMGLKAELCIPPKGQPTYFDDIGRAHVRQVFPGKSVITESDLVYYRTLAPYNPALVQIAEIPTGEIKQFDTDAHGQWRVAAKFAYRRIKTS